MEVPVPATLSRFYLPALALLLVILIFVRKLYLLKRKWAEEHADSEAMLQRARQDRKSLDKEYNQPDA